VSHFIGNITLDKKISARGGNQAGCTIVADQKFQVPVDFFF